jgi:hypothetical protein
VGIHTGRPTLTEEGYVGEDVHLAARVAAAAHGGQVVMTMATRRKIGTDDGMHGLGEHRLKDITDPVALYQLGAEAGAADRAAILIGGAEQLVARTGGVLGVVESRLRNATAAAIERRIGSVALEIDLAKGRTLEPDRVFDLALTTLDETRPRQSL